MKNQNDQTSQNPKRNRLVLMRGLPSCGKSWTAKRIAEAGAGVVIEFDSFFEREVAGEPGVKEFAWKRSELLAARRWNIERVREEVLKGTSLVVVDDDHRLSASAKGMAAFAMLHNYVVELAEPESPWWQTIKSLLEDKEKNAEALAAWAQKLCLLNRSTHGVHLETFVTRMNNWQVDLSPLDLISWGETPTQVTKKDTEVAA